MRKIAIIGGTGIDNPDTLKGFEKKIIETPFGKALCNIGTMSGNQVVFVSRHGVDHSVPPHKVNYRANIWAMKSLGTEEIFATTAVGSLNPEMKAGHFVVCDNVLDFTKSRINTFYDSPERGVAHCDFTYPYCPTLREKVIKCLEKTDITFHKHGVYVCTEGPRFETAAEVRMFRMFGAQVIGQTLVPEAPLARDLGIQYAAIGVISNYATGMMSLVTDDSIGSVMHQMRDSVFNLCFELIESKSC